MAEVIPFMVRRGLAAVVCVIALAVVAVAVVVGAQAPAGGVAQTQRPVFRAGVELITVEVQVVDRAGKPIAGLSADAFDVSLDGRKRRVVSATFVSHLSGTVPASVGGSLNPGATVPVAATTPAPSPGIPPRLFLIAIDAASVSPSQGKATIDAAAAFVRRAVRSDLIGLFTYPTGPKVNPTADHESVIKALAQVHPQANLTPPGEFNLSPSDLVELSRDRTDAPTTEAQGLRDQLCDDDLLCLIRLANEVSMSLMYYEGIAQASIGMLDGLMRALAPLPGRKTLVLISGGLVSSDMPGGRPDNHQLGLMAGRTAAEANVNVYTLYIDKASTTLQSAETRRAPNRTANRQRDSDLRAKWLDEFTGAAGGTVVRLLSGSGEFVFDRIIQETSAYYLLGVEPAGTDRDRRLHEVRVKAAGRDLTVRGRSWVRLPKPGEAVAAVARSTTPSAGVAPPTAPPLPPRPLDPGVRELAALYDAVDQAAFVVRARAATAGQLIAAFSDGPSPWPDSPRQSAVFALELALNALRGGSRFAQDEALRLLVDYGVRVRGATPDNPFECAWLRTEVAGLEGLFAPEITSVLVGRARDRCPSDARLRLAAAVAADQQLFRGRTNRPLSRSAPVDLDTESLRVLELFDAAAGADATRYEARLRQAWLLHRAGQSADGLQRMSGLGEPDEPYLRYLGRLLRGQMLLELGDPAAVAVLQSAVGAWPSPHAALVALMTAHVTLGDVGQAAAIAGRIEIMPAGATPDPWWTYWLGDIRAYGDRIAYLKGLAK